MRCERTCIAVRWERLTEHLPFARVVNDSLRVPALRPVAPTSVRVASRLPHAG